MANENDELNNENSTEDIVANEENALNEEQVAPEDRDLDSAEVSEAMKIAKLEGELEVAKAEVAKENDKYLRALAEFENYKKRAMKERSEMLKYQGEKILADVVNILDDLERALEHSEAEPEKLKEGIDLIQKNFVNVLSKWGVVGNSALGSKFDPNTHNALGRVPSADVEPGIVVSELKKAYFYKDRLLRAGDVVVADAMPVAEEAKSEE